MLIKGTVEALSTHDPNFFITWPGAYLIVILSNCLHFFYLLKYGTGFVLLGFWNSMTYSKIFSEFFMTYVKQFTWCKKQLVVFTVFFIRINCFSDLFVFQLLMLPIHFQKVYCFSKTFHDHTSISGLSRFSMTHTYPEETFRHALWLWNSCIFYEHRTKAVQDLGLFVCFSDVCQASLTKFNSIYYGQNHFLPSMLEVTLQWASTPSREEYRYLLLNVTKPG